MRRRLEGVGQIFIVVLPTKIVPSGPGTQSWIGKRPGRKKKPNLSEPQEHWVAHHGRASCVARQPVDHTFVQLVWIGR